MNIRKLLLPVASGAILLAGFTHAQDPVQVFILAGQSNMQGHGWHDDRTDNGIDEDGTIRKMIENDVDGTFDYLLDGSSNWIARNDVYTFTVDGNRSGALTVGYGVDSTKTGAEYGFGWQVGDAHSQDVLLIKTCWGGKSLKTDFRPPSAVEKRGGEIGFYYNEMLSVVADVLANIDSYVPGYAGQGYEIKGFGWHQGWNDRVDQSATDEYEQNLVDLIKDVRFDLGAAELPFVVANTGIGGFGETGRALALMEAQLNVGDPALYPEFDGNVVAIDTRPFWREASVSPITSGNQGFHWNQNGETMFLIGDAMGAAMASMSPSYVPYRQAYLEVHQQTGEIKIVNPTDNLGSFAFKGYAISSASGALDPAEWSAIAGNRDGQGDASVDSGDWSVGTITFTELSEDAVPGGSDGSIAIGSEVSLGTGTWIQNLNKDLTGSYTNPGDVTKKLYVVYTGVENIPADLNFDGMVDAADWSIFISNAQADLSTLTGPAAYQRGDLDGQLDNDLRDYVLFRTEFETHNPAPAAFEAMISEGKQ